MNEIPDTTWNSATEWLTAHPAPVEDARPTMTREELLAKVQSVILNAPSGSTLSELIVDAICPAPAPVEPVKTEGQQIAEQYRDSTLLANAIDIILGCRDDDHRKALAAQAESHRREMEGLRLRCAMQAADFFHFRNIDVSDQSIYDAVRAVPLTATTPAPTPATPAPQVKRETPEEMAERMVTVRNDGGVVVSGQFYVDANRGGAVSGVLAIIRAAQAAAYNHAADVLEKENWSIAAKVVRGLAEDGGGK